MRIAFYGRLGETVGREIELSGLAGRTIADVRRAIAEKYPPAAVEIMSPRVRAYLNDAAVSEDQVIGPDDEAAFLPPVSGG